MPTLAAPMDFAKLEGRNFVGHLLGTAPSSPVKGQLYMNTADNTLYWYDGSTWQSAKGGGASGPASGDLTGTYPGPTIAAGVVTDTKVAAANKDGTAATPSLRTLGSGAQQAAPGNDARLSDARAPTAHKTSHEPGGSDALTVDAAVGTGSLRTLGAGAQQAMPGNRTLDVITAPAADLNLNSKKITALADPSAATDGANKQYVDNTVQGLDAKQSVKAASTANLTLSGTQTVDGIALVAGDRVLVKDQTTPAQNGIYVVAAGAWARATDMDSWAEVPSSYTWVEQGTVNGDTGWIALVDQGGTIGSSAITWTMFSGAGQISAGAGLTKAGNTLDVGAGSGISVAADTIAVDATVARYYSSATHAAGASISIPQSTHGCRASRGLVVMTVVEATGAEILGDVVVAANGDVTVTFAASQGANTIRITIIG